MVLEGFGTALPEHAFAQKELAELHTGFCMLDETRDRTLRALYRRSGVKHRASVVLDRSDGPLDERQRFFEPAETECDRGPTTAHRMALYERHAPALAVSAARAALADAGTDVAEVTHLVTVSCTGFIAPGLDAAVIDQLGLAPTTQRTHVGFMGCHGALNGLRVARSFVDADARHVPLVCAVELCTLHFSYGWDPDMLVANALFADGAAAVVGRAASEPYDEWTTAASGTLLMPDSEDDMTWRIGDNGFRMTLSARVPDVIEERLGGWIESWLCESGLTVDNVESWAIHPGGPRILSSVEAALGIDRARTDVSRKVLADHGNMSSATVLFIVDELRKADAPRPCVALAFGPGLVVEALLIR